MYWLTIATYEMSNLENANANQKLWCLWNTVNLVWLDIPVESLIHTQCRKHFCDLDPVESEGYLSVTFCQFLEPSCNLEVFVKDLMERANALSVTVRSPSCWEAAAEKNFKSIPHLYVLFKMTRQYFNKPMTKARNSINNLFAIHLILINIFQYETTHWFSHWLFAFSEQSGCDIITFVIFFFFQ